MPVVQLQYDGQVISRHRVEVGCGLVIGRHSGSDVVIDSGAVSEHHARIDALEEGYFITDLESTNGTVLNGMVISTSQLRHGDIIRIGRHRLIFGYAKGESRPARATPKTMTSGASRCRIPSPEVTAYLSLVTGGDGEISLTMAELQIGKAPTCDIVVRGFWVGRVSLTIRKGTNGFQANYIGGLRRPRVNGVPLRDSVRLRDFDTIEIGSTSMQFVYRDSAPI